MKYPTDEQGNTAYLRGQDDALAGADRDRAPWSATASDFTERCMAATYQRGYGYGMQLALQRRFGDLPTA